MKCPAVPVTENQGHSEVKPRSILGFARARRQRGGASPVGILTAAVLCWAVLGSVGCGTSSSTSDKTLVVNSLEDMTTPPVGVVTLRDAIDRLEAGGKITFDPSLDGKTIGLTVVEESHSILKGEVYSGMTFEGYEDRDYGKSALYAHKDVVIDASDLAQGITIAWQGGDASHARVLAVYGDLTMKNVTVKSGYSEAEAITEGTQPYTLARGGGLAVWGLVQLEHCTISGNKVVGDYVASRDRGTYGGGIYANGLDLEDCVISGNSALGYGAAGGGIYSVGGADNLGGLGNDTSLSRCTVSGNRVTAQHAYGGGVFTLSGGPNNLATMRLTNCTIARNLAEDNSDLPEAGQYYYRGGGVYMGGGSLSIMSCTIVENEVTGYLAEFSGKPNRAGGGLCATIGNAHVVEDVYLQHSIVAGNKVNGETADIYSGSLLNFTSGGYNLIGGLDFSQILVPCPEWLTLSRKHYPKSGDLDGIAAEDVLDLAGVHRDASIVSAGPDTGQPAVLWYSPLGAAVDQIPNLEYSVNAVYAGYEGYGAAEDDFLNQMLARLRTDYVSILGEDFGTDFGDLTGVTWYGPAQSWPTDPANVPWIAFWRALDTALGTSLGTVGIGDDVWATFSSGPLGNVTMTVTTQSFTVLPATTDQLGTARPRGSKLDIGAIEK
jgi:hypothetical protein